MNEFSEEERHLITLSARKRTGFTQKPDIIQILSYFIFLWNIISQILVSFPALTYLAVQLSLTAFVMGSSIALGVCAVSVAVTDPTDEHVVITKYLAASKNEIYAPKHLNFFCDNCQSYVSESVKHCRACNRCVKDFDHHCRWINNCIAGSNYAKFIRLVKAVIWFSASNTLSKVTGLVLILTDLDTPMSSKSLSVLSSYHLPYLIILGTEVIIYGGLSVVVVNFLKYHHWLKANNLTTFSHIQLLRKDAPKPMKERDRAEIGTVPGSAATTKVLTAKVLPLVKHQAKRDRNEFHRVQVDEGSKQSVEKGDPALEDAGSDLKAEVKVTHKRLAGPNDRKFKQDVKSESVDPKAQVPKTKPMKKSNDLVDSRTRVSPLMSFDSREGVAQKRNEVQTRETKIPSARGDAKARLTGLLEHENSEGRRSIDESKSKLESMSNSNSESPMLPSAAQADQRPLGSHLANRMVPKTTQQKRRAINTPPQTSVDRIAGSQNTGRSQDEETSRVSNSDPPADDPLDKADHEDADRSQQYEQGKSFVSLGDESRMGENTNLELELADSARQQRLALTISQRRQELAAQDP